MSAETSGLFMGYDDIWLLDGVRTPFVDYNGALGLVSPIDLGALLVQRVCGTGIEAISQAADAVTLKKIELGLCVGAESMSRNPVAAFTHRSGFRMGQVEFKDFLWEALLDPAPGVTMGETAETVAGTYKITREDVDRFAELSLSRARSLRKRVAFYREKSCLLSAKFSSLTVTSRAAFNCPKEWKVSRWIHTFVLPHSKRSRR